MFFRLSVLTCRLIFALNCCLTKLEMTFELQLATQSRWFGRGSIWSIGDPNDPLWINIPPNVNIVFNRYYHLFLSFPSSSIPPSLRAVCIRCQTELFPLRFIRLSRSHHPHSSGNNMHFFENVLNFTSLITEELGKSASFYDEIYSLLA